MLMRNPLESRVDFCGEGRRSKRECGKRATDLLVSCRRSCTLIKNGRGQEHSVKSFIYLFIFKMPGEQYLSQNMSCYKVAGVKKKKKMKFMKN